MRWRWRGGGQLGRWEHVGDVIQEVGRWDIMVRWFAMLATVSVALQTTVGS